jgi:hypothetical protein
MAREYRILHHRQSGLGGHWDLVENPVLTRSLAAHAPHGEGTLCAALIQLAEEGWTPRMELFGNQAQAGESHILLERS